MSRSAAGLAAIACLIPALTLAAPADAADVIGGPLLAGTGVIETPLPGAAPLPKINADTWLIADATTGEVLAAKNPHGHVRPASTLKTLTSVMLMPVLDRNKVHVATDKDVRVEGSHVGIVAGATYTVWDLWNGLLLPSGNDAATALANQNGGVAKTVAQMQSVAHALQANDTHVVNPSGLDADGQVSSAYDMALIAAAAMKIPDFRTITNTKSYAFPGFMPKSGKARKTFQIYTENRLLRHNYPGIAGGKTGFTSLAHRTFWAAADRNGHMLIVTLFQIHEPTQTAATALLNWGFANSTKVKPIGVLANPVASEILPVAVSTSSATSSPANGGIVGAPAESEHSASASLSSHIAWVTGLGILAAGVTAMLLRRRTIRRRTADRATGRHLAQARAETALDAGNIKV